VIPRSTIEASLECIDKGATRWNRTLRNCRDSIIICCASLQKTMPMQSSAFVGYVIRDFDLNPIRNYQSPDNL
jgi:hypothetical protein